jgi:hypothetical protein
MSAAACDKTIHPADAAQLKAILAELPDGAVLCLSAGIYRANLWIERSITVRGTGAVVVDGGHQRPTVAIAADHLNVTFEGLTLKNGDGTAGGRGGNLWVGSDSKVLLRDVTLEHGSSSANGGGGFLAHEGTLVLERCRIVSNSGKRACAALVDGGANVTLRDCVVADNVDATGRPRPAILVGEAAQLQLEHTTIVQGGGAAVSIAGTLGNAPTVRISGSILADTPLEIATPGPAARVEISSSALAAPLPDGIIGVGNVVGSLGLDGQHRPGAGSIAHGRGPR